MLSLIITCIQAFLVTLTASFVLAAWRKDRREGKNPDSYVLYSAVATAVLTLGIALFDYMRQQGDAVENNSRFEATVSRLQRVLNGNQQLSRASSNIADSLHKQLAFSNSLSDLQQQQLGRQAAILDALNAARDSQQIQLREQRNLSNAQRDLFLSSLRERYPLQLPLSVQGVIRYSTNDPMLKPWVDSLYHFAKEEITRRSARGDSSFSRNLLSARGLTIDLDGHDGTLFFHMDPDGAIKPDSVHYLRVPEQVRIASAPWVLHHVRVSGSIQNPQRPFGFTLQFNASASEEVLLISHPSGRRSPMYPHWVLVSFSEGVIREWFFDRSAYIVHQSSSLSLLDLHCSQLSLRIGPREVARTDVPAAKFEHLVIGFGPPERYREIQLEEERLNPRGDNTMMAGLNLADIFPAVSEMFSGKETTLPESDLSPNIIGRCGTSSERVDRSRQ